MFSWVFESQQNLFIEDVHNVLLSSIALIDSLDGQTGLVHVPMDNSPRISPPDLFCWQLIVIGLNCALINLTFLQVIRLACNMYNPYQGERYLLFDLGEGLDALEKLNLTLI